MVGSTSSSRPCLRCWRSSQTIKNVVGVVWQPVFESRRYRRSSWCLFVVPKLNTVYCSVEVFPCRWGCSVVWCWLLLLMESHAGPRAASVAPFLALSCKYKELDGGGTKMFHWRFVSTMNRERRFLRLVLVKTNAFVVVNVLSKRKMLESRERKNLRLLRRWLGTATAWPVQVWGRDWVEAFWKLWAQ